MLLCCFFPSILAFFWHRHLILAQSIMLCLSVLCSDDELGGSRWFGSSTGLCQFLLELFAVASL